MIKFSEHFNIDYDNAVKNREIFDEYFLPALKKEIPDLDPTTINIKKGRVFLNESVGVGDSYWMIWLKTGDPIIVQFATNTKTATKHSPTKPELFEIPNDYQPKWVLEILEENIK